MESPDRLINGVGTICKEGDTVRKAAGIDSPLLGLFCKDVGTYSLAILGFKVHLFLLAVNKLSCGAGREASKLSLDGDEERVQPFRELTKTFRESTKTFKWLTKTIKEPTKVY
jgi:hypothetical protein